MFVLPGFLNTFLIENNFEFIELIQKSDWKHTYIIKVKKDNKFFILKAFSNETPDDIKKKFINEINFYKKEYKEYLAHLILYTDNILILEYIEGITLREYLIHGNISNAVLDKLIYLTDTLYIDNKILSHNIDDFKNAYSHLSALIQSGPRQTNNMKISFIKKIKNRIVLIYLKLKLKLLLNKIDTSKLKGNFVHGDFHYNNILVTSNNDIKFIDFENINHDGFFDFDILYLITMIEVYLNKNELNDFQIKVNQLTKNEIVLQEILKLYRIAISFNVKFNLQIS